jgi:hypothetical protein
VAKRAAPSKASRRRRTGRIAADLHLCGFPLVDLGGQLSNPLLALEALAGLAIGTQACPSPEKAQAPTRIPRTAPRRSRPLKPADAKALVGAYEAGKSMKDLAPEFAINRVTVSNHLRRAKIAIRQVGLAPEQTAEVVHLYQIGWSSGRLGNHFDVSADTVLRTLRRVGSWFGHAVADLDRSKAPSP